jgi:hypothetical protein
MHLFVLSAKGEGGGEEGRKPRFYFEFLPTFLKCHCTSIEMDLAKSGIN